MALSPHIEVTLEKLIDSRAPCEHSLPRLTDRGRSCDQFSSDGRTADVANAIAPVERAILTTVFITSELTRNPVDTATPR